MSDFDIVRRYIGHVRAHVGAASTNTVLEALRRIESEFDTAKNRARKFKNISNVINGGKRRSGCC